MKLDTACENAENARRLSETQRNQARFRLLGVSIATPLRVSQRVALFATGCWTVNHVSRVSTPGSHRGTEPTEAGHLGASVPRWRLIVTHQSEFWG